MKQLLNLLTCLLTADARTQLIFMVTTFNVSSFYMNIMTMAKNGHITCSMTHLLKLLLHIQ